MSRHPDWRPLDLRPDANLPLGNSTYEALRAANRPRWWISPIRSTITSIEIGVLIFVCLVGLTCQFCTTFAFLGDDCRGPGAAHPGGCPEYMAVTNFRFFALFVADLLIPVVLLIWFKRKQLQRKHRTIALVLYGLFLIFGQFLVFLPPLPPK